MKTCLIMVKVMGIEPMSESISIGASPSAGHDLEFASADAHDQAAASAIPLFPSEAGITH